MARYWVGGTASWDGTAGTKWALTSGGTGGETVPTTADDVFFSALSTGTCTIAAGNTGAKSIDCTGFTGTIAGTANITLAGSVTLVAGQTYTHTGVITFTGTSTITTAGKTFSGVTVNGSGITVTLGDALNISTRELIITTGTFDTANYNITASRLNLGGTSTRTVNFGSSTLTLSTNSNPVAIFQNTNLTFNAGTSQINLTTNNVSFPYTFGGAYISYVFYNVAWIGSGNFNIGINGSHTFNDLSISRTPSSGVSNFGITANQTVNGTFTCAGSSATARVFVLSGNIGTARTITAATLSANDCDFRDITIAGGAAGTAPTRAGDCGGNTGITFPAAKTVYWNLTGTQSWNATAWATTSSGTPAVNNFPLAQDTATFTNSGSAGTVSFGTSYNVGTIDASGRTSAMSINHNASHNIYGSYTLGSGVSVVTSANNQIFCGRGTQTFTSAGKTILFSITVDKPAGAFELGDATTTINNITHTRGTFDAKNYNLTCSRFDSNSNVSRTINMGSGLWTISGDTIVWRLGDTGLTFNKDTADILLTNTTTNGRTFSGNRSYNKVTIGGTTGTSTLVFSGSNSFTELASTKTVAHTIRFAVNQGTIDTWSVTGTAGNVVTINSAISGTRRNFTLTNVTSGIDYLSVKDIGEISGNKFYVGANSTDGGNNSNVYFTAAPTTNNSSFFMLF